MKAFFIALLLLLPTLNDPTPLVWEDLMDVEWTYDGEFYQVKFGESAQEYDGKEILV